MGGMEIRRKMELDNLQEAIDVLKNERLTVMAQMSR